MIFGFTIQEINEELNKVLAYMVTKKTVKELQDEQIRIRAQIRMARSDGEIESLGLEEGMLAAAIIGKKFGG